jgi:Glycine cleavage system P-protein
LLLKIEPLIPAGRSAVPSLLQVPINFLSNLDLTTVIDVFLMVRLVSASANLLTRRRPQKFAVCLRTVRAFVAPASNSLDDLFKPLDTFERRHVGPDATEVAKMLDKLGYRTMDEFVNDAVPQKIRIAANIVNNDSIPPYSESELLKRARDLAKVNKPFRSYIGMGYWNAVVPPVILRNVCPCPNSFATSAYPTHQIMENPAWYTQYTPYQPEVAQGQLPWPLL